ncbi:MAG: hypothetical protein APF76_11315 [Desulfitibacter sp. BRH_c19]|nr:MAG: hypothetical protein APF76_11315 [Desulfitibacter sp. BRH_c19]
MKRNVLIILALLLTFLLSLGGLAVAAPPEHAGGPNASIDSLDYEDDLFFDDDERNTKEKSEQEKKQEKETPQGLQGKGTPPGLQNKGGLPPGMQGRDVLPPGIQMRFAEVLQEKPVEPGLVISGDRFIVIPDDETLTSDYNAVFVDENGEKTSVTVDWSIENDDEIAGISFEDGTLEVSLDAESGTITISALYTTGDEEFSKTLKVELYKQEISEIKIEGPEYITFMEGQEDFINVDYTALVLDQKGSVIENETVEWSISSELDITSEEDNRVRLEVPAEEGEFTVTAENGEVSETLEVIVYSPEVNSVEISGPKYVALTEDDEVPLVLEYSAAVKDQEGRDMEKTVSWLLAEDDYEYIKIDNGEVTLSELPEEKLVFTLKAVYVVDDEVLDDELEVTVYYPYVAEVFIAGDEEVAIPSEGEIEKEYKASVLDQFDYEMQGIAVEWYLTDEDGEEITELIGVELDNGKLTVTDEAEEGSFGLWAVYEEDVFGTFEVELY